MALDEQWIKENEEKILNHFKKHYNPETEEDKKVALDLFYSLMQKVDNKLEKSEVTISKDNDIELEDLTKEKIFYDIFDSFLTSRSAGEYIEQNGENCDKLLYSHLEKKFNNPNKYVIDCRKQVEKELKKERVKKEKEKAKNEENNKEQQEPENINPELDMPDDRKAEHKKVSESLFVDQVATDKSGGFSSYQAKYKVGDKELDQKINVCSDSQMTKIAGNKISPMINVAEGKKQLLNVYDENDNTFVTVSTSVLDENIISLLKEAKDTGKPIEIDEKNKTITLPADSVTRTDADVISIVITTKQGVDVAINVDGQHIYVSDLPKDGEEAKAYSVYNCKNANKTFDFGFSTSYEQEILNGTSAMYKYTSYKTGKNITFAKMLETMDPREILAVAKQGKLENGTYLTDGKPQLLYTTMWDNNNKKQDILLVKKENGTCYAFGNFDTQTKNCSFKKITNFSVVLPEGAKTKGEYVDAGLLFSIKDRSPVILHSRIASNDQCENENCKDNATAMKSILEFTGSDVKKSSSKKSVTINGISMITKDTGSVNNFDSGIDFKEHKTSNIEREKVIDTPEQIIPDTPEGPEQPVSEPPITEQPITEQPGSGGGDNKPDKEDDKPGKPKGNFWNLMGKIALVVGVVLLVGSMFGLAAGPVLATVGLGLVFAGTALSGVAEGISSDKYALNKAYSQEELAKEAAEKVKSKYRVLCRSNEVIADLKRDLDELEHNENATEEDYKKLKKKYKIHGNVYKYLDKYEKNNRKLENQIQDAVADFTPFQLKQCLKGLFIEEKKNFIKKYAAVIENEETKAEVNKIKENLALNNEEPIIEEEAIIKEEPIIEENEPIVEEAKEDISPIAEGPVDNTEEVKEETPTEEVAPMEEEVVEEMTKADLFYAISINDDFKKFDKETRSNEQYKDISKEEMIEKYHQDKVSSPKKENNRAGFEYNRKNNIIEDYLDKNKQKEVHAYCEYKGKNFKSFSEKVLEENENLTPELIEAMYFENEKSKQFNPNNKKEAQRVNKNNFEKDLRAALRIAETKEKTAPIIEERIEETTEKDDIQNAVNKISQDEASKIRYVLELNTKRKEAQEILNARNQTSSENNSNDIIVEDAGIDLDDPSYNETQTDNKEPSNDKENDKQKTK